VQNVTLQEKRVAFKWPDLDLQPRLWIHHLIMVNVTWPH